MLKDTRTQISEDEIRTCNDRKVLLHWKGQIIAALSSVKINLMEYKTSDRSNQMTHLDWCNRAKKARESLGALVQVIDCRLGELKEQSAKSFMEKARRHLTPEEFNSILRS